MRLRVLFLAGLMLAGCGDTDRVPQTPSRTVSEAEPDAVSKLRVRLITQAQYLNTLGYIFGSDLKPEVHFQPPQRTDGLLAAGTSKAGVTGDQLEMFQRAASSVAAYAIGPEQRRFLFPCEPVERTKPDQACATKYLSSTARLLFRRPPTQQEVVQYVAIAHEATTKLGNFYDGVRVALEAMLISPATMLIVETTEADPRNAGQQRLDAFSLASRLSFFLWNAAPDEVTLRAAETGEILTAKGRAKVIDRMLSSPRLEDGVRALFDDAFHFEEFEALTKDADVYPAFTEQVLVDAREQTLRTVVDHLVRRGLDYRDLFTTRQTFLSPSLAALYQMPASAAGWTAFEFPAESPRSGLLTHISFLALHSHPSRSSPTLRGKALREIFLCQLVPPPPANVDFSLVNNPKSKYPTQRDRVNAHLENPVCAGCHKITDPMGLALENFDGSGRYRDNENGNKIDISGSLDGKSFTTVAGLSESLRNHPALPQCLAKRAYAYATGGPTGREDNELVSFFSKRFGQSGYKIVDLLRDIAMSEAFATTTKSVEGVANVASSAPQ